jgi:hypothetical protein
MGAALLLLGLFLLLSQVFRWDPAYAMLSWWPMLLIVLGVEILIYLAVAKKEDAPVKYDFISIIFIAMIGTAGIVMAFAHSAGLLGMAEKVFKAEVRTANLPAFEESSLEGIKRISVVSWPYPLNIEGTKEKQVSLFGTYEEETADGRALLKEISDYALIEKKDDTLYIKMKELPRNRFSSYMTAEATLLIPSGMKLELQAKENLINVYPRFMKADWKIESASRVQVKTDENADLAINVQDVNDIGEGDWKNMKGKTPEDDGPFEGNMTFGKGLHTLAISKTDSVDVD